MRVLLLVFLLIPSSFSISCPPQYMLVGGIKCLKMFWTPATHWEAEQNCTSFSGTLVTVKNAIDNRLVAKFASDNGISSYIWMGLSCFGNTTSNCFWDDGSGTPVYQNFLSFDIYKGNGNCHLMNLYQGPQQGKWWTVSCGNGMTPVPGFPYSYSYICETPPTNEVFYMGSCLNNYNGDCYATSRQITWYLTPARNITEAIRTCSPFYGNLVSIHSKMEIDYIRNIYKTLNASHIYLGAQANENGIFTWIDGSEWDFDYTDPLATKNGNCLVMDVKGYGLWSQVDCEEQFEFLCKQTIMVAPTPTKKVSTVEELLLDASNCNSTVFLAPGSISTFGYPDYSTPPSYCTWRLVALGPYRMGIYFDFWETNGVVTLFDEYGTNIGQFMGDMNRTPFARYTPFNIATVTFRPKPIEGVVDKGFHAVILPL